MERESWGKIMIGNKLIDWFIKHRPDLLPKPKMMKYEDVKECRLNTEHLKDTPIFYAPMKALRNNK